MDKIIIFLMVHMFLAPFAHAMPSQAAFQVNDPAAAILCAVAILTVRRL